MIVEEHKVTQPHQLMTDYLENFAKVQPFYDYAPFVQKSWQDRLHWLSENPVQHREQLVKGLLDYNEKIDNHPRALENIGALREENTYVVIGGQQAGVLTGPLYSVYKAITLVQLARQKEQELGCRVVPVFWIAGEDHDFDEVNHVYTLTSEREDVKKLTLDSEPDCRASVSHHEMDVTSLVAFVNRFWGHQPDGIGKIELAEKLEQISSQSCTLVDFFARTMAWLFGESGLILVDSALPFVRKLEQPVFQKLIQQNSQLAGLVYEQRKKVEAAGYHAQVEVEKDHAHFFIYHQGERVLLTRKAGLFVSKDGVIQLTEDELLERLAESPEQFSANVVSRPLMQEHLFPTLAFVGGPGEIAYWGLYRPAFHQMGLRMPIIVPRISMTLMEPFVQKWMKKYDIALHDVLEGRLEHKKDAWLKQREDYHLSERFDQVRHDITQVYRPLKKELAQLEKGLSTLTEQNLNRILNEVDYLQKKSFQAFRQKYDQDLSRFEQIQRSILPLDKPQERVYNIFSYLNQYGPDLVNRLMDQNFQINGLHKFIYL
ncbi:MAG: bacillithiol biosynthesis cysteine-adding enzyme BshC [Bacillaceae bacterium]|nr:bacillithiol biosynthesis cysteine-adding enzyme BshC [Bacillaceae bacterium]